MPRPSVRVDADVDASLPGVLVRPVFASALLVVVVGGAVPALADANGSTEQEKVQRSCSAPADHRYSTPGPNDCRDASGAFDGTKQYTATFYSNNVTCGDKNAVLPANPTGTRLYASQAGGVGTCSQGGVAPGIQGRANVSGSTTDGATVVVDGDKDNPNATSQGWISVNAKPGAAPTYRCGDEYDQKGRADSDAPTDADTAGECGS